MAAPPDRAVTVVGGYATCLAHYDHVSALFAGRLVELLRIVDHD